MKLITFTLISLLCTATLFSQNTKGDWNLSIVASPYPTETNNKNDFGAIGLAGLEFFVSEKVSISTSFFTSNNALFQNDSQVKIQAFGAIPSVQYYFINKKTYNVFGQLGYGFGFSSDGRTNLDNQGLRLKN